MADDWFRSSDWSEAAQAEFERRLAKSRTLKCQYLQSKASALRESGERDAAQALLLRILDRDLGEQYEQALTKELLGDLCRVVDPAEAEHYYRRLLAEHASLNGTTGTVEISLAELLIAKGDITSVDEARALLVNWLERNAAQLPSNMFRWHLALVDIAQVTNDPETARNAARTALDLAEIKTFFRRHPDIGVVKTDANTLKRLKKLAN